MATLQPTYTTDAEFPAGTYAGLSLAGVEGVGREVLELPASVTTTELEVTRPSLSTGMRLPAGLGGTIHLTSERVGLATTQPIPARSTLTGALTGLANEDNQNPSPTTFLSDFSVNNTTQGDWKYTFDFSGLDGGVLPAGSLLNTGDLDVCKPTVETIRFSADATGQWATFDLNRQIQGWPASSAPPTVAFDDVTSEYVVTGVCGNVNMGNWFTTTQPITTLHVRMTNAGGLNTFISFGIRTPVEPLAPAVGIVKTTNGVDVQAAPGQTVAAGSTVTWGYAVTNTGDTPLGNVAVTDDKLADTAIDCGAGTNIIPQLAIGQTVNCSATGTAIEGDYTNAGSVTGTPVDETGTVIDSLEPVTATDTSWYHGQATRTLTIAKVVDQAQATPGDTLRYTVTVTNTGDASIPSTVVRDELPADVEFVSATDGGTLQGDEVIWNVTDLGAGQSVAFVVETRILDTAAGSLENRAGATGTTPDGQEIDATATVETACADDTREACAVTTLPVVTPPTTGGGTTTTPTSTHPLATTGSDFPVVLTAIAGLTVLAGAATLLIARRRTRV
ncbi:DUF11 domain-containing protein [Microbacterium natoriense]|uniref:DUF11 domain-containing protein n=1 Tax=Microbacterium natoriense TaxID=284570 RepID=UPI0027D7FD58|nr:DUF11 domain-containing protein [Microbacterium natoriense]